MARFEGHVAKFLGDGVLAFFGWPRAYKKYQSGETDVTGGISRVGDVAVRTALYQAAHIILSGATPALRSAMLSP